LLLAQIFLCIFGVGIGGEYPLSASSASEKAMQNSLLGKKSQHGEERDEIRGIANNQEGRTRGRQIQLVFTMQGLGIWTQTIMLMVLLVITGQAGNNEDGYDLNILMNIWRITYLIGAAVLVFVLISRFIYLNESQVWAHDQQQQENQQSSKSIHSQSNHVNNEANDQIGMKTNESSTRLLLRMYGARLLGTSMSWLLWDISFYGNKLFQSSFLLAIMGQDISLLDYTMAAALNSTVALFGYFGAAYLIDHPNVGRLRLQFFGFMITGLLFLICGLSFEHLPSEGLVILYLLTSFFGQLGPNATTFLVPAEIFPTEQRTLCHGTSAAAGKFGALIAAFLFNFLNNDADLFLMCGYASFIACLLTFFTIPDTTNMDLLEIDRKWRMAANGVDENYNGPANDPRFLSFYERQQIESQF
jgi:MFS family permease